MNLRRIQFFLLGIVALTAAIYFLPQYQRQLLQANPSQNDAIKEIAGVSEHAQISLITQPDEGIAPILHAIENAQASLDLVSYELEDPTIEQALSAAKNRGVEVRVILNRSKRLGKSPNDTAYAFLQNNRIPIEWAPNYFPLTHQKTLVADRNEAFILTFNFAPQYYQSSRDFGVTDNDPRDVAAIEAAFNADWDGTEAAAGNADDLVWSPGSAQILVSLIDAASTSLDIYNEEMQDSRIVQALERAAKRGVNVRVDMTYNTQWKQALQELAASGVQVKTYASTAPLFIHAKVIVADNARAFVGSENFSQQSLDANRELGILISRPDIISSLEKTFDNDWAGSRPFVAN